MAGVGAREEEAAMASVVVFDVNETLLDLGALDPGFADLLGDAGLRKRWFATVLQVAFVAGLTGNYMDFTEAQRAGLRMTAAQAGRELTDGEVETVVAKMRELPPHPDVVPALTLLREAGFRVTALTNNVLDVVRDQMSNAGLTDKFDHIFSADEVGALKPAPQPYRMVAERLGSSIDELCLVAAHAWDVCGAMSAGCEGAFVSRGGAVPFPHVPRPTVVGVDLIQVAERLVAAQS